MGYMQKSVIKKAFLLACFSEEPRIVMAHEFVFDLDAPQDQAGSSGRSHLGPKLFVGRIKMGAKIPHPIATATFSVS